MNICLMNLTIPFEGYERIICNMPIRKYFMEKAKKIKIIKERLEKYNKRIL